MLGKPYNVQMGALKLLVDETKLRDNFSELH